MKKAVLIIAVLMCAVAGMAQRSHFSGRGRQETVAVGLRVGGNLSRFAYPDDGRLENLPLDSVVFNRIRPLVGLSVEVPIAGVVYVAPELTWVGRGDSRLFESSVWDTLVRYQAKTNYLELRLPVSLAIPVSRRVKPYVFAAPTVGLVLPLGSIQQSVLDSVPMVHTVSIDTNNMALYDAGVVLGAGLRYIQHFEAFSLVFKAEVGWYRGMRDTYSPKEHLDQSQASNVSAYNINGKRKNRGFEASITVALPLRFYPDACTFDGRSRLF